MCFLLFWTYSKNVFGFGHILKFADTWDRFVVFVRVFSKFPRDQDQAGRGPVFSFQLLKLMFEVLPVGFKGSLSLLEICFCPRALSTWRNNYVAQPEAV